MLSALRPERLAALASDRDFLARLDAARQQLEGYLTGPRWFQRARDEQAVGATGPLVAAPAAIAYFSPEYGITEVLPQYSGGLGILAGTTSRPRATSGCRSSASACCTGTATSPSRCPRTGGRPSATRPAIRTASRSTCCGTPPACRCGSPSPWPMPTSCTRRCGWPGWAACRCCCSTPTWRTTSALHEVTDRLYGGGTEHRLRQELLLGIGGMRAVRAFCEITGHPEPEVFHTNEGHAGFLGLERIRTYAATGLSFDAALEACRAGTVFTTHTPVPAASTASPAISSSGTSPRTPRTRRCRWSACSRSGPRPTRAVTRTSSTWP